MATFNGDFSSVTDITIPDGDVLQIKSAKDGILWRKNITYTYNHVAIAGLDSFALYSDSSCTNIITPEITTTDTGVLAKYSYTVPYGTPVYWKVTTSTDADNHYHFETIDTDYTNPKEKITSYNL